MSMEGITSYTTSPLRVATVLGLLTSLLAFCYMFYVLVCTLVYGDPARGYPTLEVTMLFLGGAQLLSLGVIGEYLGRIFHESKHRPVYIVSEVNTPARSKRPKPGSRPKSRTRSPSPQHRLTAPLAPTLTAKARAATAS